MEIKTHTLTPGVITTTNATFVNYDDSKIKARLSILEGEVDEIQREDADFNRRLSLLESNAPNYVTKPEFNSLEGRVSRLETVPVGLDEDIMDEILEDEN